MPKKLNKNKQIQNAPDYERLGRMLADVYEFGYISKKRLFVLNALRGIAVGLGSIIGATLVVAILIWILSLLPGFDPLQELLQQQIETDAS